ncbi:Cellulase [Scedosporium apiospermum]|uniref:Glucanase n=1 Tax=Pseudallescheria apiosperma TaxID=563466 RepID=A0A084GGY5_PSEDA|nr:Cellulase [Scedosporium apiospermum]KEZ46597.1 Cellulase [Scedosporium apiospermum]
MVARNLFLAAAALGSAALAVPLEARQACQTVWGQCGGIGWSGATCCASGNTCVKQNDWYFQCLPDSQAPQPTTTSRTTSSQGPIQTSSTRVTSAPGTTTTQPPVGSGTATWEGNPLSGVQMWANAYYSSEVHNLAIPSLTGTLVAKASAIAKVPSFMWMDTQAKVPQMESALADIRAANNAGANPPNAGIFVVYDLPDRDCAAAASNGEFSIADGGVAKYKAYIDSIRANVIKYSDIRIILVIEPDSLANMVTNMNVQKCANAASTYKELTIYALKQLSLPNTALYLDAGHAGWLGWPANIGPAAELFGQIYRDAGKPKSVRGLVTNVSNYNAWSLSSAPSYTSPNPNYDEKHFIEAFSPLLEAAGFPARFLMDTSRNGKQPTSQNEGSGAGVRPTTNTGHNLLDAFVWVKPPGESDGTSDTSAVRYDYHCGAASAHKPAPEAGQWFQAFFVNILQNANPAF